MLTPPIQPNWTVPTPILQASRHRETWTTNHPPNLSHCFFFERFYPHKDSETNPSITRNTWSASPLSEPINWTYLLRLPTQWLKSPWASRWWRHLESEKPVFQPISGCRTGFCTGRFQEWLKGTIIIKQHICNRLLPTASICKPPLHVQLEKKVEGAKESTIIRVLVEFSLGLHHFEWSTRSWPLLMWGKHLPSLSTSML